ncbi:NAD(P)/FAD-dependent oxidoreductase [[Eubacterium] cellulosolvens]
MNYEYLIIGGSAGGIGAIEAIREVDKIGSLAVIAEEFTPQYSKPMISEYLSEGARALNQIMYRPKKFWQENSVDILSGKKVIKVDPKKKHVTLEDKTKIGFNKLLIATGGQPIIPKIDGSSRKGVHTFTSLNDAKLILDDLSDSERIIVIGGGLIGVSLAEALMKLNKHVTIIELKEKILNLILDSKGSDLVTDVVQQTGVKIITGHSAVAISGRKDSENRVGGIILDNGVILDCDIVVFAIGVKPRIEILDPNQIKINRGVIVDCHMVTSIPYIYACGDVAEAFDFLLENSRPLPLWPLAYIGGRVAGSNMAGKKIDYLGGTQMSALNYFGLPVISAGIVNPQQDDAYEVISDLDKEHGIYKKIVIRDNIIRGFILIGKIDNAGIFFDLLKRRINVENMKEPILSNDFGLIHLTSTVRQEMLRRK